MLTFLGLVISIYTFNLYLSPASWVNSPRIGRSNWFRSHFSKQKNNEPPFFSSPKDFLGLSAEVPQTHKPVTSDSPPSQKKHMSHVPMARCCNLLMVSTQEQGITRAAGARDFRAPGSSLMDQQRSNGEWVVNNGNKNQQDIYTVYQDIYTVGDLWHFYSAPISILYSSWWFQCIWTILKHNSC